MALYRVPGSRRYKADPAGFKELGRSAGMAAATLSVAQRMAGNANAVGDATYEAANRTVRAGWNNEERAGAVVRVVTPHWRDSRDAVLVRVVAAMAISGAQDDRVVYTRRDGTTRMATQAQADNWNRR